MSVTVAFLVVTMGPLFYQLWAGRQLELSYVTLVFMAMASVLNVLWGIALTVPCSANRHTRLSLPFSAIYGAGSVLVIFVLAHAAGTPGAGLGVFLSDGVALILVLQAAFPLVALSVVEWVHETVRSPVDVFTKLVTRLRIKGASDHGK
jgi:hypothetical protein